MTPSIRPERMACLHAAIQNVALSNAPTMSRLVLEGRDGLDLLHRLSTNDLMHEALSAVTATILTTEKGRIIDTIRVVRYGSGHLLLGSADAEQEVLRWISKYTIADDVAVRSITKTTNCWRLIGPHALATADRLFAGSHKEGSAWTTSTQGGSGFVVPDRTSPSGIVYILDMGDNRSALPEIIRTEGICVVNQEENELIRILCGIPSTPGELNLQNNPYDVGLERFISKTKGCYIGQEVIARLDTYHKAKKTLIGVVGLAGVHVAVGGVLLSEDMEVGRITSLAPLTVEGRLFGLAVVLRDNAAEGTHFKTEAGAMLATSSFPMALSIM